MPRRDRTGPMGKGPLTGKGLGQCKIEGNKMDEYVKVPEGEMYEPKKYLDKAKKGTVAKKPKDIVENIL